MSKIVIIGNSAAAVGCVEGVRSVDKNSEIVLIASEKHHTYSRPLISYLLYGKTDEQRMKYRPDSFYSDNMVDTMLGKTAVSVDPKGHTVKLESGEVISYDKLMVATGSSPFVPPMKGLDKVEKKFTFMTLDDAHALDKAISAESRVLVIGAGLIGLKCVEGIADKVKEIAVVDMADRILPSVLDAEGAELVQKSIEKHGVKFYLNDSAAELEPNKAKLKSGAEVEFDVLVVAVGVRPNIALLKDAGAECGRAIKTDNKCQTSLKDIYAGGDCTESYDITIGAERVLALLPNAYMQGNTAGVNMAGGEQLYENAIPMNAMGMFGYHMITAGSYEGNVYTEKEGENYKKLFYKDNRLMGYIMIGDIKRAGIYTALIKNQTPLDSIDFELIKQKPQLMAFSAEDRREKLAESH
ncbi:NAD(P)/FAD-dependent oxidoreductase [Ruminococcus sp. 210702-SL.1.03]|uniref:NAD(P)/FAD-dependent oxidoreductase n=1 Tax=Ruminococcus sp. 210702-SL.1.03 TaxID=2883233 RepID=UPI001D060408|nr:FAD-dependent oxidoreductase [Ruminococcus sp. 210702-SL.1.03]MCB6616640.1 FAD-dependent oxidoreductase [Ruminococcus sp. 210702-SL.1.03]